MGAQNSRSQGCRGTWGIDRSDMQGISQRQTARVSEHRDITSEISAN